MSQVNRPLQSKRHRLRLSAKPAQLHSRSLERALSKLGAASRSESRQKIERGEVFVNGSVCRDPMRQVSLSRDQIQIRSAEGWTQPLKASSVTLLYAFHKPKGAVTTTRDEKGRFTVYDSMPADLKDKGIKSIGRLDLHTSGLLLFTNDNQLAARLTDPAQGIEREYIVEVRGRLTPEILGSLESGVQDRGELLGAKKVELLKSSGKESRARVILVSGKNREVRRLFELSGLRVVKLKRIRFGRHLLGELKVGEWKKIEQTPNSPVALAD